jgi:hypothetical protein
MKEVAVFQLILKVKIVTDAASNWLTFTNTSKYQTRYLPFFMQNANPESDGLTSNLHYARLPLNLLAGNHNG